MEANYVREEIYTHNDNNDEPVIPEGEGWTAIWAGNTGMWWKRWLPEVEHIPAGSTDW